MKSLSVLLLILSINNNFIFCMSLEERLIEFAQTYNFTGIQQVLDQGANVNAIDRFGRTALMYACECNWAQESRINKERSSNQIKSINLLIKAGADVNIKDSEQLSPLLILAQEKDNNSAIDISSIMQKIIEAGGDTSDLIEDYPEYTKAVDEPTQMTSDVKKKKSLRKFRSFKTLFNRLTGK